MLLHHPGTNDVKAYKALKKAVKQGKIRSIGLSNWLVSIWRKRTYERTIFILNIFLLINIIMAFDIFYTCSSWFHCPDFFWYRIFSHIIYTTKFKSKIPECFSDAEAIKFRI